MKLVVIDLEGTSKEPAECHVIEWAAIEVPPPWFGQGDWPTMHVGLVRPPIPIPPETSAIHHIIDADVVDAPTWGEEQQRVVALFDADTIAVAHNAGYERTVLASLNLPCQWLCTYKAALRVWPDSPGHSNECLRYWLGIGTGRSARQEPHSAQHDVLVTAGIVRGLMGCAAVTDMLKWTDEPAMLPTCPIGDWRGKKWGEVEDSFLWWIMRKIEGVNERDVSIRFCAKAELDKRAAADEEPVIKPPKDAPF